MFVEAYMQEAEDGRPAFSHHALLSMFRICTKTLKEWTADLPRRERRAPRDRPIVARLPNAWEKPMSQADVARRHGVSPDAVAEAMRRQARLTAHRGDLANVYRPEGWKKLRVDLKTLGLRPRRVHDVRRTTNSLLIMDGATDPILTYIIWGPPKKVKDLYTTMPWVAFCREMIKLRTPEQCQPETDSTVDDTAAARREPEAEPYSVREFGAALGAEAIRAADSFEDLSVRATGFEKT